MPVHEITEILFSKANSNFTNIDIHKLELFTIIAWKLFTHFKSFVIVNSIYRDQVK